MDLLPSSQAVEVQLLDTVQKTRRWAETVFDWLIKFCILKIPLSIQEALRDELQAKGYVFCELTPA